MTISKEKEAEILRFTYAEKWRVGTIVKQLGVHHTTVTRVLEHNGLPRAQRDTAPSIIDPYVSLIIETMKNFPSLPASRLYSMACERGFEGCESHFRSRVAELRPKPTPEAYLRLKTLPGEQGQVDWGCFGQIKIGQATHSLMAFVMVLSWCRAIFLRFFLNAQMSNFLRGHEGAFHAFGGIPRVLLYDNLKSAVLERRGDAIRFHPTLLEFASHYRYEPRPVAVGRGNEKGRVERGIRYIRDNFWPARCWTDLDDLNAQAKTWCKTTSMNRPCPEDRSMTVREAFVQEQPKLLTMPKTFYPTNEQVEVKVGKTPYIRFERNDYSVPHRLTRKTLLVVASPTEVRIMDGGACVATHPRSYDRGLQIENPEHIAALVQHKQQAREQSGKNRLVHALPSSQILLEQAAQRGDNLGAIVAALLRILDQYGASETEQAIKESLSRGVSHPHGVRQALERRRQAREQPTPMAIDLNKHPKAKAIRVKPHDLSLYDRLQDTEDSIEEETEGEPHESK
jgi:transposase